MRTRNRLSGLLLIILLLLSACGGEESVSADNASVSEDLSMAMLTPTAMESPTPTVKPTPTKKPTPTPTPAEKEDSVSADSVSGNEAVSGNAAVSENETEAAEKTPEVDLSRLTVFEEHRTMYVTSGIGVNVRKGPSIKFERIGLLNYGTAVEVTAQDADGWYQIVYGDGPAYLSNKLVSDTPPATPTPVPTLTPEQQAAPPAPAPAVPVAAPAGVLMIGDSRCVMMREATGGGGVSWICENGKEYEWFKATAIPQAEGIIGRGTRVVICLGVNDADHAYSYSALINQKAAEWAARGARTYFVSVNPVGGNPWTSMEDVLNFNAIMIRELAGVPYIDTCTWLQQTGYMMIDGMHFDNETSIRIFNQIMANLR
ncbi:MAG: SGNH/GDSL hydrolase family protein [Lachnospiraceae bacterium]|nr:SGNH/GDSL hydrolase family protein [Lachnospiraceae bacterium]